MADHAHAHETPEPHLYLHGKPLADFEECHEHISPKALYWKVFGALMVLTVLTVGVSYANLGSASLVVALLLAVVKATLVCMYFMHLKYDERYHVFVFLSTLIFVAIFFIFTLFDLNSRAKLSEEQGTFFRSNYDQPPPKKQELPPGVEPAAH